MTNDVSVFGASGAIDVTALAGRANEAAKDTPRGSAPAGSDYLNFSGKTGRFTIGKDQRSIGPDEIWALDVTSFQSGWVCWKDSTPKAQRMANIYSEPPIPEPDFEEFGPFDSSKGEGWSKAKGFVVKSLGNGQQGYFKNNSISGVGAISDLQSDFAARAAAGDAAWPLFHLKEESFSSQGFKNFKPVFDIVGWLSTEQMGVLAGYIESGEDYDLDELLAASAIVDTPTLDKPARKRA